MRDRSLRASLDPATRGTHAETAQALQRACAAAGRAIPEVAGTLGRSIDAAADRLWELCEERRQAASDEDRRQIADDDAAWETLIAIPAIRDL